MGNNGGKGIADAVGDLAGKGIGIVTAASTGNIAGVVDGIKGAVGSGINLGNTIARSSRLTADDGDNSG